MTVTTTPRLAGPFTGTGASASLPFSFAVFAATDLLVTRDDAELSYGGDYTVSLNADQDASPGGSVAITAAAFTLGSAVYVETNLGAEQQTKITNLGGFFPKVIERALDRTTILIQQLLATTSRAVLLPRVATSVAGKFPTVDAGGNVVWASGGAGDSGLRIDLADAALGGALVSIPKVRTSAVPAGADERAKDFISLFDYLPVNKRADARAGIDSTTDHAVYLQGMIDDGATDIDLGYGKLNLKTPIAAGADCRWRGRGPGTTIRSSVNGRVLTTTSSGHRVAMEDFLVVGDLANANSGFAELFDPATAHVRNVSFSNFNKAALRFVQGVLIACIDVETVNCGDVGEAAIWFDPGATATVVAVLDRCYIAASATGLKATTCRLLRANDTVFESNGLATDLNGVDGLFSNCWFEANTADGAWNNCSNLERLTTVSTNPPAGIWTITDDTPANLGGTKTGAVGFATIISTTDRTHAEYGAAADTWLDLLTDRTVENYKMGGRAGGNPRHIQTFQRGWFRVKAKLLFRATTAAARQGRARILYGPTTNPTMSAATDTVTLNGHGYADGTAICFTTTGGLLTGLTASTKVYVRDATANTFKVAATFGGAAIDLTGAQSGTHFVWSEVDGSDTPLDIPASATVPLSIDTRVHVEANTLFMVQWKANNTDVYVSCTGPSGVAAGIAPSNATLSLEHLGIER